MNRSEEQPQRQRINFQCEPIGEAGDAAETKWDIIEVPNGITVKYIHWDFDAGRIYISAENGEIYVADDDGLVCDDGLAWAKVDIGQIIC